LAGKSAQESSEYKLGYEIESKRNNWSNPTSYFAVSEFDQLNDYLDKTLKDPEN
jgi:hypothetical protein